MVCMFLLSIGLNVFSHIRTLEMQITQYRGNDSVLDESVPHNMHPVPKFRITAGSRYFETQEVILWRSGWQTDVLHL